MFISSEGAETSSGITLTHTLTNTRKTSHLTTVGKCQQILAGNDIHEQPFSPKPLRRRRLAVPLQRWRCLCFCILMMILKQTSSEAAPSLSAPPAGPLLTGCALRNGQCVTMAEGPGALHAWLCSVGSGLTAIPRATHQWCVGCRCQPRACSRLGSPGLGAQGLSVSADQHAEV